MSSHIFGVAVCYSGYLDPEPRTTPSLDSITPEILTASREINKICLTLGMPPKVIAMNFMKYIERVHISVSMENFLSYLRNWADLDLRVIRNVKEERKEILLKKFQNAGENGRNRKVETLEYCGTTFYRLAEAEKPMKQPATVGRQWVSRGTHDMFLKMKKEAEEEFENKFTLYS